MLLSNLCYGQVLHHFIKNPYVIMSWHSPQRLMLHNYKLISLMRSCSLISRDHWAMAVCCHLVIIDLNMSWSHAMIIQSVISCHFYKWMLINLTIILFDIWLVDLTNPFVWLDYSFDQWRSWHCAATWWSLI